MVAISGAGTGSGAVTGTTPLSVPTLGTPVSTAAAPPQSATAKPANQPAAPANGAKPTAPTEKADPGKPVETVVEEPASTGSALDSLSALLGSADAGRARSIASALRELAPRLKNPGSRTRAYFRLIDASVSSGDLTGACSALGNARRSARPSQQGEVRQYAKDLGCE